MFSFCRIQHCLQAILLCFACLAAISASAISPNSQELALGNLLVNSSGQQRPVMRYDALLNQVARAKAEDMARRGYFNHVDPDGNGPNYLVERAGYPLPDWWGNDRQTNYVESIAAGNSSASGTWSDFMGSDMHKRHLLGESDFQRDSTAYGIGYAADPGSKYKHYWVVLTAPPRPVPLLAIASPAKNARVTTGQVTVSGSANGTGGLQVVEVRLENGAGVGAYQPATGTKNWSLVVSGLTPGSNTLRVRTRDAEGKVLAEAGRTIWYAVLKPLTVSVTGDGKITRGFLGTTEREIGRLYTITAKPIGDTVFAGWSGSRTGSSKTLTFTMEEGLQFTANFIPNPFTGRNGGYTGVLLDRTAARFDSSGTASLKITRGGVFTGTIKIGGIKYPIRGKLGLDGTASVTVKKRSGQTISVQLALDVAGNSGLLVSVAGEGWAVNSQISRALSRTAGSAIEAGRYTVALPPDSESSADAPQGNGSATLTVSKFGRAKLLVSLADGLTFSRSADVSESGNIPVFAPLYGNGGFIAGSLEFISSETADIEGTLLWVKPARSTDRYFPGGFSTTVPVVGSRYVAPLRGTPVVDVQQVENNAALALGDGNLQEPIMELATLETDNKVRLDGSEVEGLVVKITPKTGVYSGKFIHPVSGEVRRLKGVISQKQNAGFGYFLGIDRSGYSSFSAAL